MTVFVINMGISVAILMTYGGCILIQLKVLAHF